MPIGIYERKPFTKEHRKKMSEARKGRSLSEQGHKSNCQCSFCKAKRGESNPFYGKHHSEEHKRKMSKIQIGKNNPTYGLTGEKNPNWKGGSRVYWARLSRKVWEEYHGRKIPKGYLIHHKDENYKNIDPENLDLMKHSGHKKRHFQLKKLKKEEK